MLASTVKVKVSIHNLWSFKMFFYLFHKIQKPILFTVSSLILIIFLNTHWNLLLSAQYPGKCISFVFHCCMPEP